MGEDGAREHVEVELVADDAVSPFARGASVHEPEGRRRSSTVGRRDVVVTAAVGVVALALGWALGRAGADDAAPVSPTDVTEAATEETRDPVESIATVPPEDEVATGGTTNAVTTVTEPVDVAPGGPVSEPVVERVVEVAEALRGQPVEIVAYGNGRQLFELDLATSTLRSRVVTTQPFGRTRLLIAPDWVLFASSDPTFPSTLVPRGAQEREVDVGPSWQIVGVADESSLWTVVPPLDPGSETAVRRRTITGEFTDDLAYVPTSPSRVDPAGGVIVETVGATVGVLPQPAGTVADAAVSEGAEPVVTPITTGRLVAVGVDLAVAEECTLELSCALVVIDRSSGDRRTLGGPTGGTVEGPSGLARISLVGSSSISADGTKAAVEVLDPFDRAAAQRGLGVLDLVSGAVVDIGPAQDVEEAVWTPDSRFLIYARGGRVVAYDTANGATSVVADEIAAVNALAVRPAGS